MYQSFFRRIYQNVYGIARRKNCIDSATISVMFSVDGKSFNVARKSHISEVGSIRKQAEYHKPNSIMITAMVDSKKTVYQQSFNEAKNNQPIINNKSKTPNQSQTNINMNQELTPSSFSGFGQISVDEFIEKRLADDRKDRKLEEFEKELKLKKDEIISLNKIINKLEEDVIKSEKEAESLADELEEKKTMRYWAGFAGDILNGMGVNKSKIKQPLSGFLFPDSDNDSDNLKAMQQDESGIVEDDKPKDKRSEVISLIHSYLQSIDNNTLSNVFQIFSEIESDPKKAVFIIQQLKNHQSIINSK